MLRHSIHVVAIFCYLGRQEMLSAQARAADPAPVIAAGDVVIRSYDLMGNSAPAVWSGGALVTVEKDGTPTPVIHSFDVTGQDSPAVFTLSGASVVHIGRLAHLLDGTLGLAGVAYDAGGHGSGFIAWISPDHQSINTIRMSGRLLPQLITFAPDGTIWTKGWEPLDANARYINRDAGIIRHLDRAGNIIGSYLSNGALTSMPRYRLTDENGFLVSSSTRLGWHQNATAYYEISLVGNQIAEYPGVPLHGRMEVLIGLAIADNGTVFASTSVFGSSVMPIGYYLYTLDRDHREWRIVTLPNVSGPAPTALLGGHGNTLVFETNEAGLLHLFSAK